MLRSERSREPLYQCSRISIEGCKLKDRVAELSESGAIENFFVGAQRLGLTGRLTGKSVSLLRSEWHLLGMDWLTVVVLLAVGFAAGYATRAAISARRRRRFN